MAQVINAVADSGFDLLNASQRHLGKYFDIPRGVLLYHFDWIKPLLNTLYNQLIDSFNENLVLLTRPLAELRLRGRNRGFSSSKSNFKVINGSNQITT